MKSGIELNVLGTLKALNSLAFAFLCNEREREREISLFTDTKSSSILP